MATQPSTTLHYGGSLNRKTGKLSPKPTKNKIFRTLKRYEDIVRLELAGMNEQTMAAMLVISVNRLKSIKKEPEYLRTRLKLVNGIILDSADKVADIKSQRKEILSQLLPPALLCIAETLQTKATSMAEKRHQVAVAQDLMDREGTFAKISRTAVTVDGAIDFSRTDAASADLIATLRRVASPTDNTRVVSAGVIDQNILFSHSQTISAIDQQTALNDLEVQPLLEDTIK